MSILPEPHPSGDDSLVRRPLPDFRDTPLTLPRDVNKPNPNVHQGLPVAGYKKEQPQWAVDLVNQNKALEELVLRQLDSATKLEVPETRTESEGHYGDHEYTVQVKACDGRQLALARTKLEEAFYHMNRAVFKPSRLEGDLNLTFAEKLSS